MQCVAVCCSVLQCAYVNLYIYLPLQVYEYVCTYVRTYVRSVLVCAHINAKSIDVVWCVPVLMSGHVLQCVAVMLQCVVMNCNVLQCVAINVRVALLECQGIFREIETFRWKLCI